MSAARPSHAVFARENPGIVAVFLGLGLVVVWFLLTRAHYFLHFSEASFNPYYWQRRWILLPHVAGGLTAISAGLLQLWLGLTGRTGHLHKALGRIYVGAIAVGVPAGLCLALSIPDHLDYKVGLLGLDLAWALTTSMGMLAIKRRDIPQHRAWMMRSYTVTFGFATYRIIYSWVAPHVAMPHDDVADQMAVIMAWSCWSVPLLLMEVAMQLRSMRPARRKPAPAKVHALGEPVRT
ncbi:MAG TPA: DUF2306 domain-containing protein [Croceibacterium sp.]|jgi:uncharacterized membrane protein